MHTKGSVCFNNARRLVLATGVLLLASSAFAQQEYVGKYNVYGGYGFLDSPAVSLSEHGFHGQAGINMRRWLAFGFDYTIVNGTGLITPLQLPYATQRQLNAQLSQLASLHLIPSNYNLKVPLSSRTQTFAAGPQLNLVRTRLTTIFVHPDLGVMYESAKPHATDQITAGVIKQLAPSGKATDWAVFYGFGGGVDVNFSKHVSVRFQTDFVRDHLFSDILRNSRNTVRISIGPTFQFGKNIE